MHPDPAALDTPTLARCLRVTAGEERDRLVDFLRYLDPFDAREAWREAACDSLWQYCLRELHLREGAAGRRIGAMRALRRFPRLEGPLRDGRLGLTTVVTLRPVLTDENLDEVVARAAFKTDEETRELVAALQPRPAPREGLRRLNASEVASPALLAPGLLLGLALPASGSDQPAAGSGGTPMQEVDDERRPAVQDAAPEASAPASPSDADPPRAPSRPPRRPELEPVASETWSLRVTLDKDLKADLDTLRALLSHKIPDGNLSAVLREAVRCAIEKHGKRKGAVKPARPRNAPAGSKASAAEPGAASPGERAPAPGGRAPVPLDIRRAVWERDGGRCTYVSPDGRRCESRWQLEFDHVEPAARGGPSTVENTRLRCKPHNTLHAECCFGREHMVRFRRKGPVAPFAVDTTIAGEHIVHAR